MKNLIIFLSVCLILFNSNSLRGVTEKYEVLSPFGDHLYPYNSPPHPYEEEEVYDLEEEEIALGFIPGVVWFFTICFSGYGVYKLIDEFSSYQVNKMRDIIDAKRDLVKACSEIAEQSPLDSRRLCENPEIIQMTNEILHIKNQNLNIICDGSNYTPTNLKGIYSHKANSWLRAGIIKIVKHEKNHQGFMTHEHRNSRAIFPCEENRKWGRVLDSKEFCLALRKYERGTVAQHSHSFDNGDHTEFLKCRNIRLIK